MINSISYFMIVVDSFWFRFAFVRSHFVTFSAPWSVCLVWANLLYLSFFVYLCCSCCSFPFFWLTKRFHALVYQDDHLWFAVAVQKTESLFMINFPNIKKKTENISDVRAILTVCMRCLSACLFCYRIHFLKHVSRVYPPCHAMQYHVIFPSL